MSWVRNSEIAKNQYKVHLTATEKQWLKRKNEIEKLGHKIIKEGTITSFLIFQEYGEGIKQRYWAVVEIPLKLDSTI